jgi:hypothetical protein
MLIHLDRVDGSQHTVSKSALHEVFSYSTYHWLPDSSSIARPKRPERAEDFEGPQKLIAWSAKSPQMATVTPLAETTDNWFSSFAFRAWNDVRGAEVGTDSTGIQATTWIFALKPHSTVREKFTFHMPGRMSHSLWTGSLSPDGTRLAFVLDTTERPPAIVQALRYMHVSVPWQAKPVQSIWVCSITGRGGHEVAYAEPMPPGLPRAGRPSLFHIQWSPDGRKLGCMTMNGLYLVSAD